MLGHALPFFLDFLLTALLLGLYVYWFIAHHLNQPLLLVADYSRLGQHRKEVLRGRIDIGLNETGMKQVALLAEYLTRHNDTSFLRPAGRAASGDF